MTEKCPDYRPFSEELKESECAHYGSHSGLCFFGGEFQNQACPWRGRPDGKAAGQTCLF